MLCWQVTLLLSRVSGFFLLSCLTEGFFFFLFKITTNLPATSCVSTTPSNYSWEKLLKDDQFHQNRDRKHGKTLVCTTLLCNSDTLIKLQSTFLIYCVGWQESRFHWVTFINKWLLINWFIAGRWICNNFVNWASCWSECSLVQLLRCVIVTDLQGSRALRQPPPQETLAEAACSVLPLVSLYRATTTKDKRKAARPPPGKWKCCAHAAVIVWRGVVTSIQSRPTLGGRFPPRCDD